MRIGLYGMPTSGKTYILDRIDFMEVVNGSRLLREYDPDFNTRDEEDKEKDRKAIARLMREKADFIMDGHYAFGDEIAFTEDDGRLYDVYLYLYVDPLILRARMNDSEKNRKYLHYNVEDWQNKEVAGLRRYCHEHNKDFYVIDNPPKNTFDDVSDVIRFIREIVNGYSCVSFAKECADDILKKSTSSIVVLFDGDKTLTREDSSYVMFGYRTHLYDGNFYTGYQSWKQNEEFKEYIFPEINKIPVHFNKDICKQLDENSYILTSGHEKIWRFIACELHVPVYYGMQMSAETKLYITKLLQDAGKRVSAYGDSMNDYYMLKQADQGYLVTKEDGSVSRSLIGKDMEGLNLV